EGTAQFMMSVSLAEWSREGFWNPDAPGFVRALFPPTRMRDIGMNASVLAARGAGERTILTSTDSLTMQQIGVLAYEKPAIVLRMLRDVVGDSTFSTAMQTFYARWRFRHPRADDLFAT